MSKMHLNDRKSGGERETNKPEFQSRKTVADYVRDNMNNKHRKSYYQKFIALGLHKDFNEDFNMNTVRQKINDIISKVNNNVMAERITGLYLYYKENFIFLVEGSEDCVGGLMVDLHKIEKDLFNTLKILLFVDNSATTHFKIFIWRTYEPPSSTEHIMEVTDYLYEVKQTDLLNKFERLCRAVGTETGRKTTANDGGDIALSQNYVKIVPTIKDLNFLVTAKHLYNLDNYALCFQKLPPTVDYDCVVWPIPFDHTPLDVFKIGKYDVNLTFKNHA